MDCRVKSGNEEHEIKAPENFSGAFSFLVLRPPQVRVRIRIMKLS